MGMGDEDVADAFAADREGVFDRVDVLLIGRARVDDGDLAATDDERRRPLERVRTGVVGDDAAQPSDDVLRHAVRHVERTVKDQCHYETSSVGLRRPGQYGNFGTSGPIVR